MANSKQIAGLIGPTLIAIIISEAVNFHIWPTTTAPVIYLNGSLLFVAGLSIVRVHNRWTRGWPLLITLMGWLATLGGLIRMFAPESAQRVAQNATAVLSSLIVLLPIGIFLTFKAYGRATEASA